MRRQQLGVNINQTLVLSGLVQYGLCYKDVFNLQGQPAATAHIKASPAPPA